MSELWYFTYFEELVNIAGKTTKVEETMDKVSLVVTGKIDVRIDPSIPLNEGQPLRGFKYHQFIKITGLRFQFDNWQHFEKKGMNHIPVKWGYADMLSAWNRMLFCVNIYVNTLLI